MLDVDLELCFGGGLNRDFVAAGFIRDLLLDDDLDLLLDDFDPDDAFLLAAAVLSFCWAPSLAL